MNFQRYSSLFRLQLASKHSIYTHQQPSFSLFISTSETPNPQALKFECDERILPAEINTTFHFSSALNAYNSPLAQRIFRLPNVSAVFLGSDFITVTLGEQGNWAETKPLVFDNLMNHLSTDESIMDFENHMEDTAPQDGDSEDVLIIKEILATRVRPDLQDDGGDLEFIGFDTETGKVFLKMKGSCSGCPSSSDTLKNGIENMLMYYVATVTEVVALDEEPESDIDNPRSSNNIFMALEKRLAEQKKKSIEEKPHRDAEKLERKKKVDDLTAKIERGIDSGDF